MAKLSVLNRLGNAFAALLGKHGDVSAQAEQAGCSRQTVYDHAQQVQQVLADAQLPGPSRADLLEQNRRLQQENRCLKEQLAAQQQQLDRAVVLTPDKQRRLTVTADAMGLSLNQIEEVFVLLFARDDPAALAAHRGPDRSTLGRWVLAHAHAADKVLAVLDEVSRPAAKILAPDEIFFHSHPILVAVEPKSLAVLYCQRSADRSGPTWQKALAGFSALEYAIADQGSGLQAGLRALAADRQAAREAAASSADACPQPPALEVGLDVFHIEKAARPLLARLWRRVEAAWQRWEQAEQRLQRARQQRQDLRHYGPPAQKARRALERLWACYERLEQGWSRAKAALGLWRPDGQLNDPAWARAQLRAAGAVLGGPAWAKVRRLLQDGRTLTFLKRLQRQLEHAEPRTPVRAALVRLWRLEQGQGPKECPGAVLVQRLVCVRLAGSDWPGLYERVDAALAEVVRASSCVECVNSVLRMQQARHKNLSQGLLDLKRLYWNCRPFRNGKRRGKCPYQLLGVSLPTYDFWELLNADPEKLRQQLSTPKVAA